MDFKLLRLVEPYKNESIASVLVRLAKSNDIPIHLVIGN